MVGGQTQDFDTGDFDFKMYFKQHRDASKKRPDIGYTVDCKSNKGR